MGARRLRLARAGKFFVADAGPARRVQNVFVSNASAVLRESDTDHCLVIIPASVPRAAAWKITQDQDSIYISPPAGGLHWADYTVQVAVPAGHKLDFHEGM